MATQVESWDDDVDFQGDLFAHSVSTVQTSLSSRLSVHSESLAGDEDWQVLLTPNDESSTIKAIQSVKQAGIPIPRSVPSSALLGGTIKRLGKKKSRQKVQDDWEEDLELPASGGLKLRTPVTPSAPADDNEDIEWAEGSLGIRFGGTRREARNRGSSVSAMSPSVGSCMTLESDDDELNGLVLPEKPVDFNAMLAKRRKLEHDAFNESPYPPPQDCSPKPMPPQLQSSPLPEPKTPTENDDFFADFDLAGADVFDPKKLTLNRNVKVKNSKGQTPASRAAATTVTFTDKPTVSRIPRPLASLSKPPRLDPVYESGASQFQRQPRPTATTTSAQLLRSKRSAPALRSNYNAGAPKSREPFLPAGNSTARSHHISSKQSSGHLRGNSDPNRAVSPALRSYSRMSVNQHPDTPSRSGHRRDVVPPSLARAAASQKQIQQPIRRRQFGDGNELDAFDDLPTSATKESKFVKQPVSRGPPKTLRQTQSVSRLAHHPERMQTPLPPATPRSPTKMENLPRFARDTAASRNAREQRLGARSRGEGPLNPVSINWKTQVAARSPHNSPSSQRNKGKGTGKQPFLIKQMHAPTAKSMSRPFHSLDDLLTLISDEKGMLYNPHLHRWEGNEAALTPFTSTTTLALPPHNQQPSLRPTHIPAPPPSPPRVPALITNVSATARGVQVERGMVFDPRRMCWLKLADPMSPSASVDDEADPFANIDDLKEDHDKVVLGAGGKDTSAKAMDPFVGEEFDLGPEFIRRQKEEEREWRRRVDGWVGESRDVIGDGWRWGVRELVMGRGFMGL
ncbi:hypothetical protein M501DRAFT_219759 [Patellaria atrata CBS 101060]|uniref:Cytokinesis regulator n=1 Tax=Patellaria atrata CBS 101060 TaxID=1346257 RepID=A0A9P4S6Z8_9PEZI|nr:hypothetical protein M501DRAFT_219759 [Patellaria atrata CBS 101060]